MPPVVRNVAIIVGVALVISLSSTAAAGAVALRGLLSLLILVAMCYFGYLLWKEHRHRLQYLPSAQRALLVGAVVLAVLLVLSSSFWVHGALQAIVFFVLLGGCAYAVYRVVEESRRYY